MHDLEHARLQSLRKPLAVLRPNVATVVDGVRRHALGVVEGHPEVKKDARAVLGGDFDADAADLVTATVDDVVRSNGPLLVDVDASRRSAGKSDGASPPRIVSIRADA